MCYISDDKPSLHRSAKSQSSVDVVTYPISPVSLTPSGFQAGVEHFCAHSDSTIHKYRGIWNKHGKMKLLQTIATFEHLCVHPRFLVLCVSEGSGISMEKIQPLLIIVEFQHFAAQNKSLHAVSSDNEKTSNAALHQKLQIPTVANYVAIKFRQLAKS